jgi:hypothetical protein
MPETVDARTGALASLRPRVRIPPSARDALVRLTPVTVGTWALGGFYFSLMPALIRVATGATLPVVGGLVVSALTLSGALSVLSLRSIAAGRIVRGGTVALALGVAVTLAGVDRQVVSLMLAGTIVSGIGFGAAFSGTLRIALPIAAVGERAALMSAFYVEGYLSFSVPAIIAGLAVPLTGLTTVAWAYGSAVIALAVISMIATWGRDLSASR